MKRYLHFSILTWCSSTATVLTFYFIAVDNWQDVYFMLLLSWFRVHHSLVFLLRFDVLQSWASGMWRCIMGHVNACDFWCSFETSRIICLAARTHLRRWGSSYICLIFHSLSLRHQSPSSCHLTQRFSFLTCGNSCFRFVVLWTVFCTNFLTVKCFLFVQKWRMKHVKFTVDSLYFRF